jgi:uncharacterized protein
MPSLVKVASLYRYPVKSLRGISLAEVMVERIGWQGDRRWMVVDKTGKFLTIREHPVMTQIVCDMTTSGPTNSMILHHAQHGGVAVSNPTTGASLRTVRVWGDDVDAVTGDAAAGAFLSKILGQPVDLVYLARADARPVDMAFGKDGDATSFSDGYPVLLTSTASLENLNDRLAEVGAAAIDVRRFRPNLVISGAAAWAEDTWQRLRIGDVTYRVAKPCARCVVTTRDADSGEQVDRQEPLRTLATFHRAANGGIIFGQNLIPEMAGTIRIGDAVEVLARGPSNLGSRPEKSGAAAAIR